MGVNFVYNSRLEFAIFTPSSASAVATIVLRAFFCTSLEALEFRSTFGPSWTALDRSTKWSLLVLTQLNAAVIYSVYATWFAAFFGFFCCFDHHGSVLVYAGHDLDFCMRESISGSAHTKMWGAGQCDDASMLAQKFPFNRERTGQVFVEDRFLYTVARRTNLLPILASDRQVNCSYATTHLEKAHEHESCLQQ